MLLQHAACFVLSAYNNKTTTKQQQICSNVFQHAFAYLFIQMRCLTCNKYQLPTMFQSKARTRIHSAQAWQNMLHKKAKKKYVHMY